jgi:hypothetical protein
LAVSRGADLAEVVRAAEEDRLAEVVGCPESGPVRRARLLARAAAARPGLARLPVLAGPRYAQGELEERRQDPCVSAEARLRVLGLLERRWA